MLILNFQTRRFNGGSWQCCSSPVIHDFFWRSACDTVKLTLQVGFIIIIMICPQAFASVDLSILARQLWLPRPPSATSWISEAEYLPFLPMAINLRVSNICWSSATIQVRIALLKFRSNKSWNGFWNLNWILLQSTSRRSSLRSWHSQYDGALEYSGEIGPPPGHYDTVRVTLTSMTVRHRLRVRLPGQLGRRAGSAVHCSTHAASF